MARGRETEILERKGNSLTRRLFGRAQKTEVMPSVKDTGVTWVMDSSQEDTPPVQIQAGSQIGNYLVKKVLSENTGEAVLLHVEHNGQEFVLKLYHHSKTPKTELINILAGLNSDYVVRGVDQGWYRNRFYEVLPFYRRGDLLEQMPFTEEVLVSIIVPSVNEGLRALHEKDIIHRDIKPSNIFMSDDNKKAVIGDFGISSILNDDISVRATTMSRTLGYSAPETANGFVSKESDYYAFGITLYHLVLGVNPFEGMSDMQILYQTINKRIEIPQTVSYRLQCLIKGLTIKDRNNRWAYEEVKQWLAGKQVDIRDQIPIGHDIRPYHFLKNEYYDLAALSMAFATSWENAKKHLFRGLVEKYLATINQEMASQCMDLKEMEDKNLAVFKLIYLLNPGAPLCYKGILYNDLEALGDAMVANAPVMIPEVVEMIANGALHSFVKEKQYDPKLIQAIYGVMLALRHNPKSNKYFKLMYLLNPGMGFEVNKVRCERLVDLIELLESYDDEKRNEALDRIIDDDLFFAWMEALGYDDQIEKWENMYKRVEW